MWASETHNEWIEKTNRKLLLLLLIFFRLQFIFCPLETVPTFFILLTLALFRANRKQKCKMLTLSSFFHYSFPLNVCFERHFRLVSTDFPLDSDQPLFYSFSLSVCVCVHNRIHLVHSALCRKMSGRKLRIRDFLFKRSFEDPIKFEEVVKIWMNCHWNINKRLQREIREELKSVRKQFNWSEKWLTCVRFFGDVSKRERKRFDCVHCTSFSNIIQIRRDYL